MRSRYTVIVLAFAVLSHFQGGLYESLLFESTGDAGRPLWPAALLPAVLFALAHSYQAQGPGELAGILAVTGLGAIIFSYIFVQWGGNIWAPSAIHAFLNVCWGVFAVDDTALGGLYANGLRLVVIALALLFCFFAPRFGWLTPWKRGGADGREAVT